MGERENAYRLINLSIFSLLENFVNIVIRVEGGDFEGKKRKRKKTFSCFKTNSNSVTHDNLSRRKKKGEKPFTCTLTLTPKNNRKGTEKEKKNNFLKRFIMQSAKRVYVLCEKIY